MAFTQRDNTGSLFTNDRKTAENHPTLKGSITIAGVQYDLAAWEKVGSNGTAYLSLSVKPKQERRPPPEGFRAAKPTSELESELGF